MASVPLFALFEKLLSKRLSDFFCSTKSRFYHFFFYGFDEFFYKFKDAKSKHFIKKALFKFTKIYAINANYRILTR